MTDLSLGDDELHLIEHAVTLGGVLPVSYSVGHYRPAMSVLLMFGVFDPVRVGDEPSHRLTPLGVEVVNEKGWTIR